MNICIESQLLWLLLLFSAPTILRDVKAGSKVMQEEIFGPLLPIVPISGLGGAIDFINQGEKSLVIYVFSTDKKVTHAQALAHGGNSTVRFIHPKNKPF